MPDPIRLRFAPSPTGYLHIGSARTALFNWLYARHLAGQGLDASFLLRIEDTDLERSKPELIDVIFNTLEWLGIDWDGEPVLQSSLADEHRGAVARLLESGAAYRCACTQDEVAARVAASGVPGYDGFCRDRAVSAEVAHVVRFRVPDEGSTAFDDLIRGRVSFEHSSLEDFVLQRRDGSPMFVVANAVDDLAMRITHVIRGEDLLNVTPKMLLVRAALGTPQPPVFAHLPLIVGDNRKKLSKRRDDVAIADYQARGILPEAMVNYLALLGWGPSDGVEVRPIREIVELFEAADINPASAMFDVKKLEAINGEYLRALPVDGFVAASEPFLAAAPWAERVDPAVFAALAPDVQLRVRRLDEVPGTVDFVFLAEPEIDEASWQKVMGAEGAAPLLDAAIAAFDGVAAEGDGAWVRDRLHAETLAVAERAGLKLGKAQAPVRVAVTGRTVGPPLFEALEVLGSETVLGRLRAARARL